jgi:hypothetical protein
VDLIGGGGEGREHAAAGGAGVLLATLRGEDGLELGPVEPGFLQRGERDVERDKAAAALIA